MGDKGYSRPNMTGGYTHYDSKGNKIGRTEPGMFGGYNHYDAKGNKIGRTEESLFGGYTHYDAKGHKTGHSYEGFMGSYSHYDEKGNKVGYSDESAFGGYSNNSSDGCYVATCIYGSYDTPEVWTLRRFRDLWLGERLWGRAFIYTYYAVSPKLVALFGEARWFHRICQGILDPFVKTLQKKGYEDTKYEDIDWRGRKRSHSNTCSR